MLSSSSWNGDIAMKHYRSIHAGDIDLTVMGIRILGFRINSEMPESQRITHIHDHDQLVICLQGRCRIHMNGAHEGGRPGAVFLISASQPHVIEIPRRTPPLCLVIDLRLPSELKASRSRCDLTSLDLSNIKNRVAGLFRNPQIETPPLRLQFASAICDLLDPVLKELGCIARPAGTRYQAGPKPIARMLDRILERPGSEQMEITQIAERLGYQQDHLNRRLKAETGFTIGQYRARKILKRAQHYLRAGHSIQETAELTGFADKNYFSRWFRLQTGLTATVWRRENVTPANTHDHGDLFDHPTDGRQST
jgi:AraC family L-rhamnose operon transcriptional activator RhaR